MDVFFFLTSTFFCHFVAFGLRPSGSGFDGFFLFFDFQLLFLFHWFLLTAVLFRLWRILFFASTCSFFSHFIGFGLRLSGSFLDRFFLFFDLQLLSPFYFLWFKAVGLSLWWIFIWFFDLQLLFPFYWLWFKAVGFFPWRILFLFRLAASFSFFSLWVKLVGFRFWWIFFVFRLAPSFPILLALV